MIGTRRRLYVIGLALDFCVLDTAITAKTAGFGEVWIVLDLARAAHWFTSQVPFRLTSSTRSYSSSVILTMKAALVMPATIEHIRAISEHGERMPAKSTYFYPKLLSGLVFHSHE